MTFLLFVGMSTYSFVSAQSCDTLRNYDVPSDNTYITWSSSAPGLILGQNIIDDGEDDYQLDTWLEPYNLGTSSSYIKAVRMLPWKVQNNSGNAKLSIVVYNDNGGVPGSVIATQQVEYDDFNPEMVWTQVDFDTPFQVSGKFYVGYTVPFTSPVDTFALATTMPTNQNYTLFQAKGPVGSYFYNQWLGVDFAFTFNGQDIYSAFAFDVLLSNGTNPVAEFDMVSDKACLSGTFNVDASASTGTIDNYIWIIGDNPYTESYVEKENGAAIDQISPDRSSPQTQALYLLVEGACTADAVGYIIDVYPDLSATVSKTDAACGQDNGSISVSNVTGGVSPYLYSIDGGGNTQPGASFTGLGEGSYDVVVIGDADGCMYSESIAISSVSGETITVGEDLAICAGEDVDLTASGNGDIEWFIGAASQGTGTTLNVTPAGTVTYDAVLTDANGCTSTDQITVTVNDLPTVDAGEDVEICLYNPVVELSGTPVGGTFSGTGVTGDSFDPSVGEGQYTITYTYQDDNGCSNDATMTITVDGCLGLNANEIHKITIAPNPASDFVEITLANETTLYGVQLVSAEGKIIAVDAQANGENTFRVATSNLSKGVYVMQLNTNNGLMTKKLMVK